MIPGGLLFTERQGASYRYLKGNTVKCFMRISHHNCEPSVWLIVAVHPCSLELAVLSGGTAHQIIIAMTECKACLHSPSGCDCCLKSGCKILTEPVANLLNSAGVYADQLIHFQGCRVQKRADFGLVSMHQDLLG